MDSTFLMLLGGAFAGVVVGAALMRLLAPSRNIQGADPALKEKLVELQARNETIQTQLKESREDASRLQRELTQAREKAAALEAEQRTLTKKQAEMEQQTRLQFENLANKLFDDHSKKFSSQSQKNLNEILTPLKERFTEFQKKVDESFGAQNQQQKSLKEEIERIVLTADSLTKALKGDVKAQGNWGEIILERILEEAGLQKGRDYVVQGEGMGLRDAESGRQQKPDVIINLPDNKHVIIDSKVSLTHYERLCAAEDEAEQAANLKQFLQSLRNHVSGLAERRYQDTEKLGSPDFVFMFLPIEGAYSLALQHDPDLHGYAWSNRVAIVCPTTLFASMKTVETLWKIENQNRNTLEIARVGGALYDKVCGFVQDMERLGNQIGTVQKTFDTSMVKLQGKGGMLSQSEKMRKLGASASKQIPQHLLDETIEDTNSENENEKLLTAAY